MVDKEQVSRVSEQESVSTQGESSPTEDTNHSEVSAGANGSDASKVNPSRAGSGTSVRRSIEEMVGTDLSSEELEYLRPQFERGLGKHLGMHYLFIGPDKVEAELLVTPDLLQPAGIVHGGTYATIVEELASVAGSWYLRGKGHAVGANNNTDFFRPVSSGTLRGVATPLHRGKTQQLWLVIITDENQKEIARGQLRLANRMYEKKTTAESE